MTVYLHRAGLDQPPLRRPPAHADQMTALIVPVRVTPAGRAWVPPARPAAPATPAADVDLTALDLGRWSLLDLLLMPLAVWLAEEPGRRRRPTYQPRHRTKTTGGPR